MIHNQLKITKNTKTLKLKCAFTLNKEQCEASLPVVAYYRYKTLPHFKLYLSECCCFVVNEIQQFKKQSEKFYFHYFGSSLSGRSSAGFLGQ